MDIFDKIELLLKEKGISGAKMSRDLGFSNAVFTQWKQRKQKPSLEKIQKMTEYFNVPIAYLLSTNGFCPDNLEEARKEWELARTSELAYNGLMSILADIFDGMEIKNVVGRYGSTTITIFGKGDKAFVLGDDDIQAILESVKVAIPPIAERLKYNVNDSVSEMLAFLNSSEAKADYDKYSPSTQKLIDEVWEKEAGENATEEKR